jgi:hypothetical protein
LLFLFLLVFGEQALGQTRISGIIKDLDSGFAISNVNIRNIYTQEIVVTDQEGKFTINVQKGQLLECKHVQYQVLRVRIQSDVTPKFYNLVLRLNTRKLEEIFVVNKDQINFTKDSAKRAEEYRIILNKPRQSDMSWGVLAVEYMSKKRRQEFAFVQNFEMFEREKYIDYKFNQRQLKKWTGLNDEDLVEFMRKYRPGYNYLRSTNEYNYYLYLKKSLNEFCPKCVLRIR